MIVASIAALMMPKSVLYKRFRSERLKSYLPRKVERPAAFISLTPSGDFQRYLVNRSVAGTVRPATGHLKLILTGGRPCTSFGPDMTFQPDGMVKRRPRSPILVDEYLHAGDTNDGLMSISGPPDRSVDRRDERWHPPSIANVAVTRRRGNFLRQGKPNKARLFIVRHAPKYHS